MLSLHDADDHYLVANAHEVLGALSVEDRPLLTMAKAIKALARDGDGAISEWSSTGAAGAVGFTPDERLRHLRDYPMAHRWISKLAMFRSDGRDPLQHRAVDFLTAVAGNRDHMALSQQLVYEPMGIRDQLRVLIGEPGEGTLTCCMLFTTRPDVDRRRELARLQALVPALRDAAAAYRALGAEFGGLAAAARALDAFDEPAWLCSDRGRVLHRNEAAGQVGSATPACVLAAARAPGSAPRCTRARRLTLNDATAVLVTFRRERLPEPDLARAAPTRGAFAGLLSGPLAAVAERVAAGQTDAQIALALGRPLATVRTYVLRVYRRLGIHGRAELIHLARELEKASG